jgi:hypothetical protein
MTTRDGFMLWDEDGDPLPGQTVEYYVVGGSAPEDLRYTATEDGGTGYYYADVEDGSYDIWVNGSKDSIRSPRTVNTSAVAAHLINYSNPHRVSCAQLGAVATGSILDQINASTEATKINPNQLQSISPAKITGTAVVTSDSRLSNVRIPVTASVLPIHINPLYELAPSGSAAKLATIAYNAQPMPSGSQIATLLNAYNSTLLKTAAQESALNNFLLGKDASGSNALRTAGIPITAADCDSTVVVRESGSVLVPKEIRIFDIQPVKSDLAFTTELARFAYTASKGILGNKLRVLFKWNWDKLRITASGSTITVDGYADDKGTQHDTSPTWGANELVGFYIFVNTRGVSYEILSHSATGGGVTVFTVDGTVGTINHGDDDYRTWIHNNVERYGYQVTPVHPSTNTEVLERVIEGFNGISHSPIRMNCSMELDLGQKYRFKLQGIGVGGSLSTLITMPSGSYYHNSVAQSYDQPFACVPANVTGSNVSMVLTSSDYGFRISISDLSNNWSEVTDIEVVYNPKASGAASFTDANHVKLITSDRQIEISTNTSQLQSVAIRPLIMGYAVGDVLTGEVVSGGGGIAPQDEVLATIPVRHQAYLGTYLTGSGDFNARVQDSTLSTFGNGGTIDGAKTVSAGQWVGDTIYFPDNDNKIFLIVNHRFDGSYHDLNVVPLAGSSDIVPDAGCDCEIGTVRRGRRVHRSNAMMVSYTVTRMTIAADVVTGPNIPTDPLKVRVYNTNNEAGFGSTTVLTSDSERTTDISSVEILSGEHYIIDLYDSSGDTSYDGYSGNANANRTGIVGKITLYGRKKTVRSLSSLTEAALSQSL